jgi:hypothetical protein
MAVEPASSGIGEAGRDMGWLELSGVHDTVPGDE